MSSKKGWNRYFKNKKIGTLDEKLVRELIIFLKLLKKGKILELGYGDGKYCFLISKNKNFEVFGIDYSKEALKVVQNHKIKHKIKNAHFKFGDINNLTKFYKKESFDAILMINSYHCLKNNQRKNVLSSIRKILKKG